MRTISKVPEIVDLINQGLTAKEITEQVGCTRMNVHSVAKRYGLKLKLADRRKYSPEDKQKMKELRLKGYTCAEIADINHAPADTVKKITNGIGQQIFRNQYSAKNFDSESHARIMINNYLNERNIEYEGNYKGADGTVDLRCKKCGTIFTRSMCSVRGNKVNCPECKAKLRQQRKDKLENDRIARVKLKEEEKQLRILAKVQREKDKEHPCAVCGHTTKHPVYCSKKCANKVKHKNNEIKRQRKIKNAIVDKDISLEKIYQRDKGICYICGLKCFYSDYVKKDNTFIAGNYYPSIEHIKPLSKGGLHSWDNVRLAHRICNTMKGAGELT